MHAFYPNAKRFFIVENSKSNKAGVNRAHGRSVAPKWTFAIGHLSIILDSA
jgi:hypothetical protein